MLSKETQGRLIAVHIVNATENKNTLLISASYDLFLAVGVILLAVYFW